MRLNPGRPQNPGPLGGGARRVRSTSKPARSCASRSKRCQDAGIRSTPRGGLGRPALDKVGNMFGNPAQKWTRSAVRTIAGQPGHQARLPSRSPARRQHARAPGSRPRHHGQPPASHRQLTMQHRSSGQDGGQGGRPELRPGKPCRTGPSAPICIATGTVAGGGTNTTPGHVPSVRPDDARGVPKIWVRAVRAPRARSKDREHLDRGVHLGDENRRHRISAGRPAGLPPADDGHARAGRCRARTAARPDYATNKGMTP
jgi:hypothetical protein